MIYGIGTDLVDPARIAGSLERYGEQFARRVLADSEWPDYLEHIKPALFLAKRFAAKEAFPKQRARACVPRSCSEIWLFSMIRRESPILSFSRSWLNG